MAEDKSSVGGGFALDIGEVDDPFDTTVKVTLSGLKTGTKADDKGDEPGKDDDHQDDKGGRGGADKGDDREAGGARARSDDGDDDEEEDAGGLTDRDRLRVSRRNSKRLKRALRGQSNILTGVQSELAETQGMVVNLVKGNIVRDLHTAESRLTQLRATKLQAREKEDHALETQCEDEIGAVTASIADLKGQQSQLEKLQAPKAGNAMLTNWLADADDWYSKPGFETETAKAQGISQQLAAQGIGRGDPRHYDEIDRQMQPVLKKRFADMTDDDVEADGAGSDKNAGKGKDRDEPMRGVAGGGKRQASGGGGSRRGPQVPKALVDSWRAGGFDVTKPEVQQKMWDRYQETQRNHGLS